MIVDKTMKMFERKLTPAERFFMYSPYSIVTMVVRIKGNVSKEMLRKAVVRAQRRHALLSVRIQAAEDQERWFTSDRVQEIPIEILPRTTKNDWIKIHAEASKIPFEFETRPAIRFILIHSQEISELVILCHHSICDGMSLAYLARDLMVNLGDPAFQVEELPAPPGIDLDNLPADVSQSALVKFMINRMNKKWSRERVFFDIEDYKTLTKVYWDNYSHKTCPIELTEVETSTLVARCRKEKVTVNSALAAAFGGAQSFVQGEKPYHRKFVVAANLRDRLPNSPGEGFGMYAGGVELKFRYNHNATFWENARKFHQVIVPKITNKNLFSDLLNWLYLDPTILEAINFKKLGALIPMAAGQDAALDAKQYEKLSTFSRKEDVVLRLLQRDKLDTLERKHWGTAVTNLGRLDFPKNYGSLELDRLIMQPGGGIPLSNVNLVVGSVTCSGKLSLVVEYAEQAIDRETIEKIIDKTLTYLFEGAKENMRILRMGENDGTAGIQ